MEYIWPYDQSGFAAKKKKRMPCILARFLLHVFTNWSLILMSLKFVKKGQINTDLFLFSWLIRTRVQKHREIAPLTNLKLSENVYTQFENKCSESQMCLLWYTKLHSAVLGHSLAVPCKPIVLQDFPCCLGTRWKKLSILSYCVSVDMFTNLLFKITSFLYNYDSLRCFLSNFRQSWMHVRV